MDDWNKTQWDRVFQEEGYHKKPHPDMEKLAEKFKEKEVERVLDFGCGNVRHTVFLARKGFDVYGFDISEKGLEIAEKWLKKEELGADLKKHDMNKELPYKDNFFDALISVQVLHHNTPKELEETIKEINRVLKKGALLYVTVPKKRNQGKEFKKIDENTYIPLDGREEGLPHFYFDEELIKEYFENFKIEDIHIDDYDHYCILGIKK